MTNSNTIGGNTLKNNTVALFLETTSAVLVINLFEMVSNRLLYTVKTHEYEIIIFSLSI